MKPSLPQGTRDFNAEVIRKRQFILNTIKDVFELYGFDPLETPAMENLETLLGKYGDESDKLIYRILDSGNPFSKKDFIDTFIEILKAVQKNSKEDNEKNLEQVRHIGIHSGPYDVPFYNMNPAIIKFRVNELLNNPKLQEKYLPKLKTEISEKALRYDLTIPFARYVSMNCNKLTMPFKRYQMQPVWRADRPQKGRYREFYQCDADVAGTTSLISDAELALIYLQVFGKLRIDMDIKINSRKILAALAEICGESEKMNAITVAIDKLDKIGIQKVKEELTEINLSAQQILIIEKYLQIEGTNDEKLNKAELLLTGSETGKKGIEELKIILDYVKEAAGLRYKSSVKIDYTLARGLNYYTGSIYEVKAKNVDMGSIGGGGRYDDLTGLFGLPNIPGVGISFGVDRIYDVMNELNIFPEELNKSTTALFFNLGQKEAEFAFREMQLLRNNGISCEMFYENSKMDKQFKYASRKNIPFAVIIGSDEMEQKTCIVKDLLKAEQQTIPLENLPIYFKL
jgi:histidyl-tRNA synthetase